MNKTAWVVHAIAECKTCKKSWQNYRTAHKLAAAHANETGHNVMVEEGKMIEYNATEYRKHHGI